MDNFNISSVILYKNGIANFERTGVVDKEDVMVELFFPSNAMNDILKSINVTSSGDHKHTITYEVPSTSSSSSSVLAPITTHQDLYSRLVRENVQIGTNKTDQMIQGMVLAVDFDPYRMDNNSGKISLFTKDNQVVTISLNDVISLRIPTSLVSQSKSLKINISSQQKQEIKINYIRSCPIWKATYRAILGASQNEYKIYGWATIHNPGPDDWKGVRVSLVAGQPVSFINEVYKPKYKKRPRIRSTATHNPLGISSLLVSSLLNDETDSEGDDVIKKDRKELNRGRDRRRGISRSASRSTSRSRTRSRSRSPPPIPAQSRSVPASSVAESEISDLFRYDLTTPIDLVHGHSALVSIFECSVQGRKVALFNSNLHKEHPFSALVMHNTTGLALEGGSITVFDGDMYIGEANLTITKPNERRFLPFALELGVVISTLPTRSPAQPWNRVRVDRNVVTMSRKSVKVHHYVIVNKSERPVELLLEHPKDRASDPSDLSLIVEESYHGSEKSKIDVKTEYVTNGHYGLSFILPPRSTSHILLHSQTIEHHTDSQLRNRQYYKEKFDEVLMVKLSKIMTIYWTKQETVDNLERSLTEEKERLSKLEKSQTRTRENLRAMTQESQKNKYSDQMDKLEEQITSCDANIRNLQDKVQSSSHELRALGDHIVFDSASEK